MSDTSRGAIARFGPPASLVVGIGTWAASLGSVHAEQSTGVGLVSQLPPLWWLGLAAITLAFSWEVTKRAPRRSLLVPGLIALVVVLHGTTAAVEATPRFATAWLHAGFVDLIARTGHAFTGIDARMSWPGFFAGFALLSKATGVSPVWFLRWSPLVSNLLYLLPIGAIASAILPSRSARWFAVWLFVCVQWVGQDYFSPQGANYLIYLTIVAIVLRVVARPEAALQRRSPAAWARRTWGRIERLLGAPDEIGELVPDPLDVGASQRILATAVVCVLAGAIVVSHQLTPVILIVTLGLLAVIGARRTYGLAAVVGVMFLAWLSWAAYPFWSGHASSLFGSFGSVGSTVSQNVGNRLGGDAGRQFVLRSRIVLTAFVWLLGIVGWWRALRCGQRHLVALVLMVAPMLIIGGQSYGGEVLLRIYLFSLPGAVILAALVVFPADGSDRRGSTRGTRVVVAAMSAVALVLFPFARYGNERFELISTVDVATVDWVTANLPRDSIVAAANQNLPWRYELMERLDYRPDLSSATLKTAAEVEAAYRPLEHVAYLVLTPSEERYGEVIDGLEVGWMERMKAELIANGHFTVVHDSDGGAVLTYHP